MRTIASVVASQEPHARTRMTTASTTPEIVATRITVAPTALESASRGLPKLELCWWKLHVGRPSDVAWEQFCREVVVPYNFAAHGVKCPMLRAERVRGA